MKLQIIDTGINSPMENMRIDEQLLDSLRSASGGILHFYDWQGPSATFGYFTNPFDFLDCQGVQKHNLQLARRPTGGGIIFHQFDFAFSVLVPAVHPRYSINTLENYALVNEVIADCVLDLMDLPEKPTLLITEDKGQARECRHFCMAKPTVYDVVVNGRKIAGGAQRRTKSGFLHQGSISLILPPEQFLKEVLKQGSPVAEAMRQTSFPLLQENCSFTHIQELKSSLRKRLSEL